MRIFKEGVFEDPCPICDTKNKGDSVLIGVDGSEVGNNMEAKLFHVECLNLTYYKDTNKSIIAQVIRK